MLFHTINAFFWHVPFLDVGSYFSTTRGACVQEKHSIHLIDLWKATMITHKLVGSADFVKQGTVRMHAVIVQMDATTLALFVADRTSQKYCRNCERKTQSSA